MIGMDFMLADRIDRLSTESAFEVFRKAKQLEAQGRSIIHMEIGQPDFPTAPHICEAAFRAMQQGYTGYAPAAGMPELQRAIADTVLHSRGVLIDPSQVVVTPGAKPIIFFTILALVNPGDEVIYPNPGFPAYESVINFVKAKPVPLPLVEEADFRFRIKDLEAAISDRTRLLILNSPQNPTGGVLTPDDLAAIAHLAKRHDFYVLADEIYSRILYDTEFHSIYSQPGMPERTILLDGHSKTYAMTGWRLGYGIAPKAIAQAIELLIINSESCTCAFTQLAGVAALTGPQTVVTDMVNEFKRRRDRVVAALNAIDGITCQTPQGAFYAFPNVKQLPMGDRALSDYLLNEAGVAVLPGSSFGKYGDGYLRLSYANSMENLMEGLNRMKIAIEKL